MKQQNTQNCSELVTDRLRMPRGWPLSVALSFPPGLVRPFPGGLCTSFFSTVGDFAASTLFSCFVLFRSFSGGLLSNDTPEMKKEIDF